MPSRDGGRGAGKFGIPPRRRLTSIARFISGLRPNGIYGAPNGIYGAPAHGMMDAPAALFKTLNGYFRRQKDSRAMVRVRIQASNFDLCQYIAFRAREGAVGVATTHIGDILGRGDLEVLDLA